MKFYNNQNVFESVTNFRIYNSQNNHPTANIFHSLYLSVRKASFSFLLLSSPDLRRIFQDWYSYNYSFKRLAEVLLLIDHTLMLADKPFSFAHIFVRLSLHQNGRIRTRISRLTTITADTVLPIKLRSEVPVSPGRHGYPDEHTVSASTAGFSPLFLCVHFGYLRVRDHAHLDCLSGQGFAPCMMVISFSSIRSGRKLLPSLAPPWVCPSFYSASTYSATG